MHKIRKPVQENEAVKLVFTPAHFVSFSIARNFQSHLVRSKLYLLQCTAGFCKYNTLAVRLAKILKKVKFSSNATKKTFKVNHYFGFNSNSMVCLISSNVCGKQYVRFLMSCLSWL